MNFDIDLCINFVNQSKIQSVILWYWLTTNEGMKDDIQDLFIASEKMNGSAMSLLRCLILVMSSFYIDGLQYRELKSAFKISDGKLSSNLKQLEKFGYLKKDAIQFDNKKMTLYTLTSEGQNELKKMREWMESIIKIIRRSVQK